MTEGVYILYGYNVCVQKLLTNKKIFNRIKKYFNKYDILSDVCNKNISIATSQNHKMKNLTRCLIEYMEEELNLENLGSCGDGIGFVGEDDYFVLGYNIDGMNIKDLLKLDIELLEEKGKILELENIARHRVIEFKTYGENEDDPFYWC